jgi:hypothetical protein
MANIENEFEKVSKMDPPQPTKAPAAVSLMKGDHIPVVLMRFTFMLSRPQATAVVVAVVETLMLMPWTH